MRKYSLFLALTAEYDLKLGREVYCLLDVQTFLRPFVLDKVRANSVELGGAL